MIQLERELNEINEQISNLDATIEVLQKEEKLLQDEVQTIQVCFHNIQHVKLLISRNINVGIKNSKMKKLHLYHQIKI